MKTHIRRGLSVIAGLVAGFIVISIVEGASSLIFPPPAGLDLNDQQALRDFIQGLPAGALLFVLLAHILGSFIAGFACVAVSGEGWRPGALVVGAIVLAGGVFNLVAIPHPVWFAIADVAIYIPAAYLGGHFAVRYKRQPSARTNT